MSEDKKPLAVGDFIEIKKTSWLVCKVIKISDSGIITVQMTTRTTTRSIHTEGKTWRRRGQQWVDA